MQTVKASHSRKLFTVTYFTTTLYRVNACRVTSVALNAWDASFRLIYLKYFSYCGFSVRRDYTENLHSRGKV